MPKKATLFNEASRKQIEAFLKGDRMRASDLKRMCKTLKIDTLASGKTELANRILAEEALHRPGGPSKLVNSMDKEELKAFLDEHWKQIEELNDCTKENDNCGYGDRSKFDKVACTHFILWAWEHMPTA